MNVSRGPVREALLVLVQQGLIKHSQNYGFSVLGFTGTDHGEVDEIRLKLETMVLSLARGRVNEADLKAMDTFLEGTATVSRQNSSAECSRPSWSFTV
jgi:DNA-binding GntR family transcriptional regulator